MVRLVVDVLSYRDSYAQLFITINITDESSCDVF